MTAVIVTAAILCALACLWVFQPVGTPRAFYRACFACALLSLGLYLALGNPNLPAHPKPVDAQAQADMRQESRFMETLQKNPKDADTMIKLAALRVVQGRDTDGTLRLLDRADAIKPNDSRIRVIRSMLEYPDPELKK